MVYRDEANRRQEPWLLKASLSASVEELLVMLLEEHQGSWPLWLAPEQLRILPLGPSERNYAEEAVAELRRAGLRVRVGDAEGPLAGRVGRAISERLPCLAVAGPTESARRSLTLRWRGSSAQDEVELAALVELFRPHGLAGLLQEDKSVLDTTRSMSCDAKGSDHPNPNEEK